jgi:hypothetical protein
MPDEEPPHEASRRSLIFAALFLASLLPLLFLKLEKASQLASELALPFAVVLTALTTIPPKRPPPLPWRRLLLIGAVLVGLVGGVGVTYAIWQNVKDMPVSFPGGGDPNAHWTEGSYTDLPIPGNPPERGHLSLVVSLSNATRTGTGDCESTATVDFTPEVDGHLGTPLHATYLGHSQYGADVSLDHPVREAKVRVTLHFEDNNTSCQVDLQIEKAVLHD